jgi:cytochrome c1
MTRRRIIAGTLPNDQANLIRWIRDPQAVDPRTAMPVLGVSERDAIDMSAYLLAH